MSKGESMLQVDPELMDAAMRYGPDSTEPPYVRAAYPMIALPRVLRDFVAEGAKAMAIEPCALATPVLGVCATAIGNTCRLRINQTWIEPAVIWSVTLLESGQLKTPAYNAAMEPLRAAQRLVEQEFLARQEDHEAAKEAGAIDHAGYTGQEGVQEPAPASRAPKPVDYFSSDSTVEALAILFANNPRGLALTRDELSGFFGSFGAYKAGRGNDESTYLEFYNAGTVKVNRANGKRIYVDQAALSIFGTCQPSVFVRAIGADGRNANQVDNGLAARFIIAAPEPRVKRYHQEAPYDSKQYARLVAALLAIPLARTPDGRVAPNLIGFQPDALAEWAQFVNQHGIQTARMSNAALRYHYAKLEGVAARLSLIFYLCEVATDEIDGEPGVHLKHVLAGIAMARWYGREAMRVYDGYEGAADKEKRELLEEIRDHGGKITPREMGRIRRRWVDPTAAEMALRSLARSGYGELVVEVNRGGGRPSLRFVLHPKWSVVNNKGEPVETEVPAEDAIEVPESAPQDVV